MKDFNQFQKLGDNVCEFLVIIVKILDSRIFLYEKVFIYLKEALELLERDNFKLSLEIITNLVLVFSYNDVRRRRKKTFLLQTYVIAVQQHKIAIKKALGGDCQCSSRSNETMGASLLLQQQQCQCFDHK